MSAVPAGPAPARRAWSAVRRLPASVQLSGLWMVAMIVVGVGADLVAPYDYQRMDLRARLTPPAWLEGGTLAHPLGTDQLGRDVLSRLVHSVRISLLVALLATFIGAVLGTVLGFLAAHFRGWVDDAIMVLIDFQAALPFIILALAVLAFFSNSFVLFVAVMGIYGWERYARIARGLALSAQAHGYAVAVKLLGARPTRIYLHHVLPNVASAIIVNMTLNFPETIIVETSLSFLGLGVQPPLTSLGNMVGYGRDYLLTAWWIAVAPATAIFLTSLALSLLGDWLRDRLDPTLQGGRG